MIKSREKLTIIFLSILICSLFGLAGCKDTENEAELTKIKADLASIISERDNLKLELDTVIEAHDKLQAAFDEVKNIKEQRPKKS